MQHPTSNPSRLIFVVIMVAVALWGAFHALGAYFGGIAAGQNGLRADARRGLVVLACIAAFLAFWLILLVTGKPRRRDDASIRRD
jgi:hypothetical protein